MRLSRRCLLGAVAGGAGALGVLAASFAVLPARAAEPVKVVATFSVLGDLVKEVGGALAVVDLLVGPNADMHAFQPTPAESRKLLGAKLVVVNGLGLEGWSDRLIKASGYAGPIAVASNGVKAMAKPDDDHDHDHGHGHDDPHAWQSVAGAKVYVANIRDALAAADPGNKAAYARNADDYLARLDALDREIVAAYADIPKDKRRVITAHQAFRYYGAAYGLDFRGAKGVGDEAEPTARDIAELIRQIKKDKIRALFVENISGHRLLDRIAKETDAKVGGTLYSDALSDAAGPAPTYIEMMRTNTKAIAAALRG
ncbi:MAG: zinc ABC transporter substrate-binding protein [Rhodoplanes sp.]|nr:zinc ABC transporter substrate-binding protein [Rhodoplanes sp.]